MEKKSNVLLSISQKPVLTHYLRYSLKILEMNNTELQEHIDSSIIDNPFLKEKEELNKSLAKLDVVESTAARVSHKDDLFKQIAFFKFDEKQKDITALLYDYLIEHRYINGEFLRRISKEKDVSYPYLLHIIKKLQTLSPYGMFSFNFQDKIKNILEACGKYDAEHKIFMRHLHILLEKGFCAFKKRVNLGDSAIRKIMSDIKRISFFHFENDDFFENINRSPDIFVKKIGCGYNAEIGDMQIPAVDYELFQLCLKKTSSKRDRKYIEEKINDAKLLIKSINYRNSTLLRIVREIAFRQSNFFTGDTSDLLPLEIASIADSIMCHKSTIHRAIANKTIATPCGVFDIKSLMPKKIKTEDSDNIVADSSVKKFIQNLITNEPSNSPYSDSEIAYLLKRQGVSMSRRTVTKYRSCLDIANSNDRRKEYSLAKI